MRRADWKERLLAEVESARTRPHVWGQHDCLQWCARCVLAITDVDYAAQFPAYDSAFGAEQIVAEYGTLSGLITHLLGEPVTPNNARTGDVIVAMIGERETAGICLGLSCAFPEDTVGLAYRNRDCIVLAWRID